MAEKKRLFQILDDMNVADTENDTATLAVCPSFVRANYGSNSGTQVTMGVPGNVVFDIEAGKKIPILILVDSAEYEKLKT